MIDRLQYENSAVCCGYLVIPYVFGIVDGEAVYSFQLLSERSHRGRFHCANNPSGLCHRSLPGIWAIARDFLDQNAEPPLDSDYFLRRYTYRDNLIIIVPEQGRWFYDHYPPNELRNLAAPKLFDSEEECLSWIQQGLARSSQLSTET